MDRAEKPFGSNQTALAVLISLISLLALVSTIAGIFSDHGTGGFEYRSIRGEDVIIYGKGIYQHMSAEVAIQGIAQDFVTLGIAIPLLLLSFFFSLKGSLRWSLVLSGTLGYFFVTYLFYLTMGMYNGLFLAYAALFGLSFFSLAIALLSFDLRNLSSQFHGRPPVKFAGGLLIFSSIIIAFLWLSIVLPPLLDGTLYPQSVEHYTTLIVQGLDLGLLLPLAFVSGYLLIQRKNMGYLIGPIYLVFLSLLMLALTGKIIYMGSMGYSNIPVIFIIPTFSLIAIGCSYFLLKSTK